MSASPAHRALTMVELMVVLAVLALLLGLLLPTLSIVSAAGRSTQCRSNLRQMALAAHAYTMVYTVYPAAIRYEDGGIQVAWDWVTTFTGELISPGSLWGFSNDPGQVQQCPDYQGETNFADPFTGYNYNTTFIGAEGTLATPGWEDLRWGVPLGQHRRTVETAMFGDGGRAGGTNKFMRAPMNSEGYALDVIYSGGQAFRHQRSTNVAYLDGHVDSVGKPYAGALATESLLEDVMGYPENGFLSDDDSAYDPR